VTDITRHSYKLVEFGKPVQPVDEAVAAPAGSEVVVRIAACGVCHSDLHLADGYFDLGGGQRLDMSRATPLPHVLGHEIVGTVIAVGPDAPEGLIGQRRLVYPWIGCGACAVCESGEEHLCMRPRSLGINVDGGFATHVTLPDARYLVDIDGLDEKLACTYACSGLTAFSALKKIGRRAEGESVLIIGAGGVGLAAVHLAAKVLGVRPFVADLDPAKREAALKSGAIEAIDPNEPDLRRRLLKQTGGFAGVIDFVGAESTAEMGVAVLRKGGHFVSVGLFGGALKLPLPTLAMRGISITGSYVGSPAELRELVALLREQGPYPLPVTPRPLDEAQQALDDLRAGHVVGRIVLTPSG
jgi:D-arabinose 1-dehydrogenase-like Zn-dependent alcohol dehydrogenase